MARRGTIKPSVAFRMLNQIRKEKAATRPQETLAARIEDLTFSLHEARPRNGQKPSLTFFAILDQLVEATKAVRAEVESGS